MANFIRPSTPRNWADDDDDDWCLEEHQQKHGSDITYNTDEATSPQSIANSTEQLATAEVNTRPSIYKWAYDDDEEDGEDEDDWTPEEYVEKYGNDITFTTDQISSPQPAPFTPPSSPPANDDQPSTTELEATGAFETPPAVENQDDTQYQYIPECYCLNYMSDYEEYQRTGNKPSVWYRSMAKNEICCDRPAYAELSDRPGVRENYAYIWRAVKVAAGGYKLGTNWVYKPSSLRNDVRFDDQDAVQVTAAKGNDQIQDLVTIGERADSPVDSETSCSTMPTSPELSDDEDQPNKVDAATDICFKHQPIASTVEEIAYDDENVSDLDTVSQLIESFVQDVSHDTPDKADQYFLDSDLMGYDDVSIDDKEPQETEADITDLNEDNYMSEPTLEIIDIATDLKNAPSTAIDSMNTNLDGDQPDLDDIPPLGSINPAPLETQINCAISSIEDQDSGSIGHENEKDDNTFNVNMEYLTDAPEETNLLENTTNMTSLTITQVNIHKGAARTLPPLRSIRDFYSIAKSSNLYTEDVRTMDEDLDTDDELDDLYFAAFGSTFTSQGNKKGTPTPASPNAPESAGWSSMSCVPWQGAGIFSTASLIGAAAVLGGIYLARHK
ncbi:hypothetical protein K504DRAFT_491689 [Pleomassaria siparia CBS 279.74]|uniref:Uncharacterized protein n=1 Tax=Pleomassaria siparia CBS 279.74 TaxID=1314801 RepID=A0A6G1K872_9PLEO|nr:hypothetical protein K504DRAFT_491689 [Pleomassaria siparia CBS 279.74]